MTVRVHLIRQPTTDQGTFGLLTVPARAVSWISLELPWRDNSPRKSCIPPGPAEGTMTYIARLREVSKWSPRLDGRLFGLLNVPGRSDIEIHAANFGGDVDLGWHTDLLGCIAPGLKSGSLIHPDVGQPQAALLSSRTALEQMMSELGDEDFALEVSWA